jgi:hypothetical protein
MEKAKPSTVATPGKKGFQRTSDRPSDAGPKTLSNLGVTKQESSDFQKLADAPQAEFERFLPSPLAA